MHCYVYGCNHKSLLDSCKFYRFCIRAVYTCTRPCTSRVHGHVQAAHTAITRKCTLPCTGCVHGSVRAVYTTVYGPCTRLLQGRIRVVNTAVCTALYCTYTARKHGRLCTRLVYTAVHTARTQPLHGRVRAVNTAEYMTLYRRTRLCTRTLCRCTQPVHGRVQAVGTAVYKPCTRSRLCTSHVCGRLHMYTARVHKSVRDPVQAEAVYTAVTAVYGR